MSKFFQALQRAEQEHTLEKQHRQETLANRTYSDSQARRVGAVVKLSPDHHQRGVVESDQALATGMVREVDPRLVSLLDPRMFEAEQYRTICHNLEQLRRTTNLSVLAVSSPAVGDGKTTTAINLAGSLVQFPETKVLLIDLDLRRPSVAQLLRLNPTDGPDVIKTLSDATLSLSNAVRSWSSSQLHILPTRTSSTAPHEILKAQRFGELLQEARRSYDYVIIDTPPLIPFSDCQFLEQWVDGFVVVIAAHKTPRKLIEEALHIIAPTKLLGLVYNNDDRPVFGYYSYYTYDNPRGVKKSWRKRTAEKLKAFR